MDVVLSDPLWARLLFGSILTLAGVGTLLSREEAAKKAWAWLAVDWVFTCYATELLTTRYAPWATPSETAIICVPLGSLAIQHRSFTVWAVIGLMVASLALSVAAFAGHWQGTYLHNAGANVLFVLRCVVLGGSGVARRLHSRDSGPRVGAHG